MKDCCESKSKRARSPLTMLPVFTDKYAVGRTVEEFVVFDKLVELDKVDAMTTSFLFSILEEVSSVPTVYRHFAEVFSTFHYPIFH